MLTCRDITELATDHAEGRLAEAERERFVRHLAGCSGCAAWVAQLQITARAAGALPPPELPAALQDALLAGFDGWAGAQGAARPARQAAPGGWSARRLPLLAGLVVLAAFALLLGVARHPSGSTREWGVALALAGVAVALAVGWRRVTPGFAAIAVSAALAASLVTGGRGPLEPEGGLECLLSVGVAAASAAAAAWAVTRRQPGRVLRGAVGAWGVAGALASVAALQVACGAHSSLAHLLTFHVGGLLAVLALAHLAQRQGGGASPRHA